MTCMYSEVMDQRTTLAQTMDQFLPALDGIMRLISDKPLFLIGTGASYNACAASKHAFAMHKGKIPQILYAAEALGYPDSLFSGAAAIVVSQSGQSHETKLLCEKLKNTSAVLIAVTADEASVLARSAHAVIPIRVGNEVSSATKTYTATVLMLYMLACGKAPYDLLQEDVALTLRLLDDRMEELFPWLEAAGHGYVAGIGSLSASAAQAALMLKEKCFLCYEGMSVNELRHGTIETVEKGTPIIMMSTGEEGCKEAALHARFLCKIGAKVLFIHDSGQPLDVPRATCVKIRCNAPPEFAHIAHAMLPQLLAERFAREKGYAVDSFRYITKVVGEY
ncbi:MAG: SIS domain-containing protein [Christensenellales bacterium]|jgi:glucosamine--fructose-6-phosphate aminotransferase (isomerizing)